MKKIILFGILFSLLFFTVSAKNRKEVVFPMNEAGKIVFTEIIEMPNLTKDVLYTRAYEWFAKAFTSAQNVIQMQDKEAGKIIGKGVFGDINTTQPLGMGKVKGVVKFTISIYLKDGKYKYEITDLIHEGIWAGEPYGKPTNGGALENEKPDCSKNYMTTGRWKDAKEETFKRVTSLIESLKKGMTVEPAGDNW